MAADDILDSGSCSVSPRSHCVGAAPTGRQRRRHLGWADISARARDRRPAVELAAVQAGSSIAPRLAVTLTGVRLGKPAEHAARTALTRLLGPDVDLSPFYRLAETDPTLRTLAARFRGRQAAALSDAVRVSCECDRLSAAHTHGRHSPPQPPRRGARDDTRPGHPLHASQILPGSPASHLKC